MNNINLVMRDEAHLPNNIKFGPVVEKENNTGQIQHSINDQNGKARISALLKVQAKLLQTQAKRLGYIRFLDKLKQEQAEVFFTGNALERICYIEALHEFQLLIISKVVKCDALTQNFLILQSRIMEN
jgi:methionyl-tRNA formyltransferase